MNNIIYVNILADALQRKKGILENILELTKKQQSMMNEPKFDISGFQDTIKQKQVLIDSLTELDGGFETVYHKVQAELREERENYKAQIIKMQELIQRNTALGMEIQALEQKNKLKLDVVVVENREKLKNSLVSNRAASSYYQHMAYGASGQFSHLDRKK